MTGVKRWCFGQIMQIILCSGVFTSPTVGRLVCCAEIRTGLCQYVARGELCAYN